MPIKEIKVYGNASGKIIKELRPNSLEMNLQISLMTYLQSQDIPIASSCSGDGVCKKCVVNTSSQEKLLSCQISLKDYLNEENFDKIITINYL